ncbi:MAG: TIGR03936 family radical SAM-associated protein [Chloroflexi bacterium]|nr:TIGR03936 family radical SAM-associated protein [Chloroflexota bacterium]
MAAPAEPRQRWRVRFKRRPDAPPLAQREQLAAWEASVAATGLPIAGLDLPVPRSRIVVAVPLTVGMAADGELLDLFLVDRRPVAEVRAALAASLPAGHELVDLQDVWLGEPSLTGRVVAADYRVELADAVTGPDRATLMTAIAALLAAPTLPRTRDKGGRSVAYDLRPLLARIDVLAETSDRPTSLRIRTRFDPERGVGRPEEVLAALAGAVGAPLEARSIVRERLVLLGDD